MRYLFFADRWFGIFSILTIIKTSFLNSAYLFVIDAGWFFSDRYDKYIYLKNVDSVRDLFSPDKRQLST